MIKFDTDKFIQTTLGELVSKEKKSIISGPFGSNVGKKFFKEEGIPLIRGNNLSKGEEKFKDDGFVFLTREKADELNCYAIKNDLIFTAVGTIGQVGIIDEKLKYDEYVISNKQLRARFDKSKITPLFAYYWFSSYWVQKLILQRNVGSTVPLINLSVLKGLPITLPKSIETQKSIVEVLENISLKIEVNNKINRELEAMAKTLYDYWFVQFDFPDANGKPYKSSGGKMVFNEALKREIPEGWEDSKLGNLSTRIGDGLHGTPKYVDDSEYSFINGNNLKNGFISIDSETKKVSVEEYEKHFIELNSNSILLSINGTLGNLATYNGEKVMLGKSSAYINCKENYGTYCYEYLNQNHMQKVFWNMATGSTIKNLGLTSIKNLKILKPKVELILKFEEMTKSIVDKRKNIFNENQKLSELRDWLLPMLLNGQVTVGEVEQELGMVAEGNTKYESL